MDELSVQMPLMTFTVLVFVIGCVAGYYLGHRSAFSQFRKLLGDIITKEVPILKAEEKSLVAKIFGFLKKVFNFLRSVKISFKRVPSPESKPKIKQAPYLESLSLGKSLDSGPEESVRRET